MRRWCHSCLLQAHSRQQTGQLQLITPQKPCMRTGCKLHQNGRMNLLFNMSNINLWLDHSFNDHFEKKNTFFVKTCGSFSLKQSVQFNPPHPPFHKKRNNVWQYDTTQCLLKVYLNKNKEMHFLDVPLLKIRDFVN